MDDDLKLHLLFPPLARPLSIPFIGILSLSKVANAAATANAD
jgi:hypothetical protein